MEGVIKVSKNRKALFEVFFSAFLFQSMERLGHRAYNRGYQVGYWEGMMDANKMHVEARMAADAKRKPKL